MPEPTMSPWTPTTDPRTQRRTGKLLEELGELTSVVARIQIQGIDEIDPSSGKTNRRRLTDETADVLAQVELAIAHFGLDTDAIRFRVSEKKRRMAEWEAFFPQAPAPQPGPGLDAAARIILTAGARSADLGAMSLAAQLARVPACNCCGYVKAHCRCAPAAKGDSDGR